jgi:hypothetical protein
MNSELPTPQFNPEYRQPTPEVGESLNTPESAGENAHEREQGMKQVDRENAPPVPVVAIPLPTAPVPALPQQPVVDDTAGPTIASDDDLIEKEWVDKAKKIIASTQNDPYTREQEVTKLQIDYLRKRYGKELGTSN